jgi:hypothetical protein
MPTLPFSCKDCGGTGEAELSTLMGVTMTCEYCGAKVTPPRYDVLLEPPEAMFEPAVIVTVAKLLGLDTKGALEVVKNTRVLGTAVPAEVAERQRSTIQKVGGKVTIRSK